jgi:hypothetical protein
VVLLTLISLSLSVGLADIGVGRLYAADYPLTYGPLGSFPAGTRVWVPSTGGTLGPLGNEEVTFFGMDLWADVPGHGATPATGEPWRLSVLFDLRLSGNWWGNAGPSLFDLVDYFPYTGERSATLLHTTFSAGSSTFPQAYPDNFPSGAHPAGTGSGGSASRYHLCYEVPDLHDLSLFGTYDLFLRLSAAGASGTWSLENVTVFAQPIPEPSTSALLLAGAACPVALAWWRRSAIR